jgi:hypothetical protein
VVFFSRQMLGVSLEIGKGLIDDGGCRDVWHVGQFLRDYTASTPPSPICLTPTGA